MSVPIEAQSLSRLNYLLANPPQYPRNPTHEAHPPLVLYIVRVPGSRDVFLTPLKPPTKASISLEAIQTSLYYLHVHGPEDEELRESVEQERNDSLESENITSNIHRKPLPSVPYANYPASQRPAPPSKSYPDYQQSLERQPEASQLERYLARGSNVSFGDSKTVHTGTISRKPLGPRRFLVPVDAHSVDTGNNEPDYAHGLGSKPAISPGPSDAGGRPASHSSSEHDQMHGASRSSDRLHQPLFETVSEEGIPIKPPRPKILELGVKQHPVITLIRRDPTSGVQWNIGTISDGGKLSESNLRSVVIEIDAPGYLKFNGQHDLVHPKDPQDAESVKRAMTSNTDPGATVVSNSEDRFTRSLEFRQQQAHGRQFRLQSRTNSIDAIPNFPIQNKPPRSVFSFFSPWQGLCSFSNGMDGRSLRCRHALPSHGADEDSVSADIAQLRFNLAWSALSPKDSDRKPAGETESDTLPISQLLKEPRIGKEVLRKKITHIKTISKDLRDRRLRERDDLPNNENMAFRPPPLPPRPQSSLDIDDASSLDRLSLKLGREKAGGGYKGNSAKLGKLIIEDEGLKMGDLVVAACMGVWWQHYAEN